MLPQTTRAPAVQNHPTRAVGHQARAGTGAHLYRQPVHDVVAWSGFLGAWLLFAGPVYQAALELREQDAAHDVHATFAGFAQPPPVSP